MMPKPKKSKSNVNYNNEVNNNSSERILYESQPNMILYSDNFIFKIIILFLLVFMFSPILALVYRIQGTLQSNYQLQFINMTYIAELILFLCILIIVVKLILDYLDWKNTLYTLTDKRIIIKRGLFNKEKISMPYLKVQDIDVSQSLLERLLGAGDIVIYGGHDNTETILDEVSNPREVEEIILNQVNKLNYSYRQSQIPRGYNEFEDYSGSPDMGKNHANNMDSQDYNQMGNQGYTPRGSQTYNHSASQGYNSHNPRSNQAYNPGSSHGYDKSQAHINNANEGHIPNRDNYPSANDYHDAGDHNPETSGNYPQHNNGRHLQSDDDYFDEYEDNSRNMNNSSDDNSKVHYFNTDDNQEYSPIGNLGNDKNEDKTSKKLNKEELLSLNKRKFKKS